MRQGMAVKPATDENSERFVNFNNLRREISAPYGGKNWIFWDFNVIMCGKRNCPPIFKIRKDACNHGKAENRYRWCR